MLCDFSQMRRLLNNSLQKECVIWCHWANLAIFKTCSQSIEQWSEMIFYGKYIPNKNYDNRVMYTLNQIILICSKRTSLIHYKVRVSERKGIPFSIIIKNNSMVRGLNGKKSWVFLFVCFGNRKETYPSHRISWAEEEFQHLHYCQEGRCS